jgi:uncharacterized membrane protein YeaQ/YmgE (transglycosylase-associated protein family)
MGIILMLVIGGIIGWVAAIATRADTRQDMALNTIIGIVGALVGGFLLTPLLGGGRVTSGAFDVGSLLLAFLGAVILLALVNLFRHAMVP